MTLFPEAMTSRSVGSMVDANGRHTSPACSANRDRTVHASRTMAERRSYVCIYCIHVVYVYICTCNVFVYVCIMNGWILDCICFLYLVLGWMDGWMNGWMRWN